MNISDIITKKFLSFNQLNDLVKNSPEELVTAVENNFKNKLEETTRLIYKLRKDSKFIMLGGPSSSGKTTTAKLMKKYFENIGIGAVYISLDDFFKNIKDVPLLPNGEYDCENIYALDLEKVRKSLADILEKNECEKPVFDFLKKRPSDVKVRLKISTNDIVICEGLHALNPLITKNIPPDKIVKIYLKTDNNIQADTKVLLSDLDIRFLRRLVRDSIFRAADANITLSMWPNVCDGEIKYIRPFIRNASFIINTFHAYEPFLFKDKALKLLNDSSLRKDFAPRVSYFKTFLPAFEALDEKLIPSDSLIREFIGN